MQWFKKITTGGVLIAGPKTYLTLPKSLRLCSDGTDRVVMIWTRDTDPQLMIRVSRQMYPEKDIFIVGGAQTYKVFLPLVDRFYISRLDYDGPADVWLPPLGLHQPANKPDSYSGL